ncbi:Transcriptional regulator containing PAS, AAA-type ATPase, and DNA-binding Fis domains [Desulfotomaculum arcticum]|uniref:Transcriptional regulator containing PAS, AAA-type ATPase, and DNA-binding Fis domains n=1 Tax=Desulfotruncus arcticus DSM 17038 TaxID=1121424 RepID=A0A1I2XYF4_9FIRM|nr:sigma-54-dependent Fis family transcriptional regulator [Desulfotruncus arcticus]SFH17101.1 Transcriptional regulator containing PAS, AAA-type ATPase, and DNA-binding Fis domains [Desulfotomaculum arcticum] [Desulfotruncus arcticus DSM 17038]
MLQLKEIMNTSIATISSLQTIGEAIKLFRNNKLNAIFVVDDDGILIGMLTLSNLFDALLRGQNLEDPIKGCYIPRNKVVFLPQDKQYSNLSQIRDWLMNSKVKETPVINNDGRPVGVVTQADVIKAFLKEMQKLYDQIYSILKVVPTGILAVNDENLITVCNQFSENLLGIQSTEVVGQDLGMIIPEINLDSNKPQKIRRNASSILATSSPVSLKPICGHIVVLYDATEIERMAQEIESVKRLQSTLETVLNTAYEGLLVINNDGKIILANRSFEQLSKKSSQDLIGQRACTIIKQFDSISKNQKDYKIEEINGQSAVVSYIPLKGAPEVSGGVLRVIYRHLDQLQDVMREFEKLKHSLSYYKDELFKLNGTRYTLDSIITKRNSEMTKVKRIASKAAECLSNVLIIGESGTGKELFAHAIHNASSRCKEPFIKVNCAAIPAELAESELFGYAPGAFTGAARQGKPGKFELANGGTIFLDEIGDMPLQLQSKLLRVIQDREIEIVGGTNTIPVDIRIIAATNKDLRLLVYQKLFRQDLFYRINVIYLPIPPLRKRKEDIEPLVNSFLSKYNSILNKNFKGITPDVLEAFKRYSWPGNIRELQNAIERAISLGANSWLTWADFSDVLEQEQNNTESTLAKDNNNMEKTILKESLQQQESELIRWALTECAGNRAKAAKLLGISRSSFYEKIKKHAIELD